MPSPDFRSTCYTLSTWIQSRIEFTTIFSFLVKGYLRYFPLPRNRVAYLSQVLLYLINVEHNYYYFTSSFVANDRLLQLTLFYRLNLINTKPLQHHVNLDTLIKFRMLQFLGSTRRGTHDIVGIQPRSSQHNALIPKGIHLFGPIDFAHMTRAQPNCW